MWGASSSKLNYSDGSDSDQSYDYVGASSLGGGLKSVRNSSLPPSMLMSLDQKCNEILGSINFDGIISSYRDTVQSADKGIIDCSAVLTHHIIDCMYALKSILKVEKSAASTQEDHSALDQKAPSVLYNGCLPELGGLVLSTISNMWGESKSPIIFNSYLSISEQIMHHFPEMFNKASKSTGDSLMHVACRYVSSMAAEPVTKMLLSHNPKLISHPNDKNQYPLHVAMRNKNLSLNVVRALLKGNEEIVSVPDSSGLLPLHFAVMTENSQNMSTEIIEYILRKDSNAARSRCKYGRLPLHLAINSPTPSLSNINLLLNLFPEGSVTACANGELPIHRLVTQPIVSLGVMKIFKQPRFKSCFEVATTKGGQLPLHLYADHSNPLDIVVLSLIDAVPNSALATDNFHYTPLNIILDNREPCFEIAKLLLYSPMGQEMVKSGVPYNTKGKASENPNIHEDSKFLYPLHFLVGMNDPVNIEMTTLVASMYPQAIVKDHATTGKCAWSPYLKAKERNLTDLLVVFDMILDVESYRNGVVQQFNENYSVHYEALMKRLKETEGSVPLTKNNGNNSNSNNNNSISQNIGNTSIVGGSPNSNISSLNQAIRLPKLSIGGLGGAGVSAMTPIPAIVKKADVSDDDIIRGLSKLASSSPLQDDADGLSLTSFTTIKTTKTAKIRTKTASSAAPSGPDFSQFANRNITGATSQLSDTVNSQLATQQHLPSTSQKNSLSASNRPNNADVDLLSYLKPNVHVNEIDRLGDYSSHRVIDNHINKSQNFGDRTAFDYDLEGYRDQGGPAKGSRRRVARERGAPPSILSGTQPFNLASSVKAYPSGLEIGQPIGRSSGLDGSVKRPDSQGSNGKGSLLAAAKFDEMV